MVNENMHQTSFDLSALRTLMHSKAHLPYAEIIDFFNQSPQLRFAGISVHKLQAKEAQLVIEHVQNIHQGGLGTSAINGGIIAMMCDLTLGLLGVDYWKAGFTATQALNVNFLQPLVATKVTASGKIERVIGKKLIGLIEVSNEKGEVCSAAHGILATGLKEK